MNRLKIAVTKGRLLEDSLDLFEQMGFDCSEVRADTRKLILPISNYPMDVVLSKAADVLTYVSHGVCDLGIVGKDTIMEHGGSFYEMLDLGFGKCRFALAVPDGSDFYGTYQNRVVASKYPNVTKAYFAEKGMDVSVIKIEGSVELAPLVGLSNGIVDIVQTGTTLKENGLTPIETVAPVSARLIVNTASMKLHQAEIFDLMDRIEAVIK
ncbi:MAG: ATP phosphoribosyltransferase [Oscillospiraceae bacterium]|nr:ATP phosphoribosyltransferase [Oscillospiraceae bacterium]